MTAGRRALRRRARRRRQNGNGGGAARTRRVSLVLVGVIGLLLVAGVATAGSAALYAKQRYDEFVAEVVPPEELLSTLPRGGARVYDRNGVLLYEFVDEFGGLRRPVPINEISEWVIKATIATEDASFFENNGLNLRGIARAGVENFSPFGNSDFFEGSGGSSITQQLAKNVYIPKEERTERSIERKLKEAAIALELTERYTKDQILEWYLNSISYGGSYVGIEAAAEGYFGKTAAELSIAEAALLAGIPQSPALYNPLTNPTVSLARQREVLDLMVRHGEITAAEASGARREEIEFRANRFEIEAAHFVLGRIAREIELRFGERALYEDGLEVVTTLDLRLQLEAERILEEKISEFEETSDGHNGALFALDARTGQILVYVGSRDYFRDDIEGRNDNVISLNSPGSTLKPLTYMTAFMQGWSTGAGILDTPAKVIDPATGQFFQPRNPSGNYQGSISARDALGNSLNIPAFKTILFAGVENTLTVMRQMGLTTLDSPLGYGPALTLGGADITLLDLTYAYSVFANGGVMRGQEALEPNDPGERTLEPVALLKVTDADGDVLYEFQEPEERRVVGSNFAYLVTSILSDPQTQCITFGCGGLGLTGRPSAQKTGTSEPFLNSRKIGDTWAFGYTPDLVAGVWAGNADNSPMVNITSTRISWRSWRDFMNFAHAELDIEAESFVQPPGIESRELCWPSGQLPSDLCPNIKRYTGLFASDVLIAIDPEEIEDTWWQEVAIDTRTGLLATALTPAAFVSREVRLVLPEEEIEDWDGLAEWVTTNGITQLLAPTEDSSESGTLLRVNSPSATQTLSGTIGILGRANSPGFRSYTVEWGRGSDPSSWIRIQQSTRRISSGLLANWDTTKVPNGAYTIRVLLEDSDRGTLRFAVPVVVDNGEAGAQQDAAPFAEIITPTAGSVVSGNVLISGLAFSGLLQQVQIEVGVGLQPESWETIRRDNLPSITGPLGFWDSTAVDDGIYTIRLIVRDQQLGTAVASVVVSVKNSD